MSFFKSESGAVTVDWVVLTAALVGLGLAAMSVVSSGVEDLSGDTSSELSDQRIFTNFNVQRYSSYYDALTNLDAQPQVAVSGGVDATFHAAVAELEEMDPADLAIAISDYAAVEATDRQDISNLLAYDPETITREELAAAVGLQNHHVNPGPDGTFAQPYNSLLAQNQRSVAYADLQRQIADKRNIAY